MTRCKDYLPESKRGERPFVDARSFHLFQTANNRYLYDYGTSSIIQISEDVFSALSDLAAGEKSRADSAPTLSSEMQAEIADMKRGGYLSRDVNEKVSAPFCEHCADHALDHRIEQLCLEVTQQCNLRCRYCAYSGIYDNNRVHRHEFMTWPTAQAAIDLFLERCDEVDIPALTFYGGEPMLNREIIRKSVEYVKARQPNSKIRFTIDTNGTCIGSEDLDFLIRNDFILQISLDGPEEVHDANRVFADRRGSYARIDSLLEEIYRRDRNYYRYNVIIAVTMAPPYPVGRLNEFFSQGKEADLRLMVSYIDEEGVDLKEVYKEEFAQGDVWREAQAVVKGYMDKMCGDGRAQLTSVEKALLDNQIIDVLANLNKKPTDHIPANGICIPGGRKLFVASDGTFLPCEKVGQDFAIGHARTGLDREVVLKMIEQYRSLCEEICLDCWVARLCRQCFASVRRHGGMSMERKRQECELEKTYWHQAFVRVATILEERPESLNFIKEIVRS